MSDQKALSTADFTRADPRFPGKKVLIDGLDKVVGQSD
ncbi:hypothetical protein C4K22_3964 [Pseudomonas chlororaphis subsp. aurantiaca]|nr:hypothetical protein C4K22_3964 [Pseudomonas chlororaphis subsp. aurantiaca]AZD43044.1 hypothetical protein C4K21_3973 [Pseudomonas chlororaphis subsp. aurantiaca]AZD55650.1 hypothetical protein C4K19_3866 [Pseudomonas chlororaphis subsp. aurantiaca]AZD61691.1 hypothetical protein C4K18_3721 [Pseudomonas chlororaphis subsp. aurantiaca]AZD80408.1 hypothetical protein C4K15_3844 [Pseudomonas chlororaphis subsp. aurantiaca]